MTELTGRVPCTIETRDDLKALKDDGERYEDLLRRLIQTHEDNA